jgi:phospholipase D1/2
LEEDKDSHFGQARLNMLDRSSMNRRVPRAGASEKLSSYRISGEDAEIPALLTPGTNVWRRSRAESVRFLVDGCNYFDALRQDLETARKSVWIIGWDFDADISLTPPNQRPVVKLGDFLRTLVDRNDELVVRILVWAEGPFYSHGLKPYLAEADWSNHPRIHMRFDSEHPVRASHHQKIVCIDEAVGFVGGIDLTSERWDKRSHRPDDPDRINSDGEAYPPVHDLQARLTGEAAGLLGDVARRRWLFGLGEDVAAAPSDPADTRAFDPDIADCAVGVALAEPGINGHERHAEPLRLTCDAIDAARRMIYIETQYLASPMVVERICARLREEDGPEVSIIVTRHMRGIIEQWTMGFGRNRAIKRLEKADMHGRLHIGYPVVADNSGNDCEILVHSKLVIVDDWFLRLGSSNLNHRSQGFDTECDVAIEAETEAHRAAIARLRNDLLAEHLGSSIEAVQSWMEETGSLCAVIDSLNGGERSIRPFHIDEHHGTSSLWRYGSGIFDPHRPYWPLQRLLVPFRSLGTKLAALKNSLM